MSGQYLSNDALCGDMVRCAVERNMGNRFENGQLKYIDVVHLVQASDNQGSIADKDDQQNVNRRLRRKLKGYLATLPESNAACFNNTDISISLLPGIVQFFCNTTFTMEQVHTIANQCKPQRRVSSGRPSRCGSRSNLQRNHNALQPTPRSVLARGVASSMPSSSQAVVGMTEQSAQGVVLDTDQPMCDPDQPLATSGSASVSREVAIITESQAACDEKSSTAIVEVVANKEQTIDHLRCELRAVQKSRAYFKGKSEHQQVVIDSLMKAYEDLSKRVNFRVGNTRCVSPWAGYTLALKRNIGHTGAYAAVAMIAGDSVHGSLKHKCHVVAYKKRAACVARLECEDEYNYMTEWTCIEVHSHRFDATNSDAIQKSKVHAQLVQSIGLGDVSFMDADGNLDIDAHQVDSQCSRSCPDLQIVNHGTAQETYCLALKGLQSVFCPTWEEWVRQAASNPQRFSMYVFGVDAGPDNTGMMRLVLGVVAGCMNVAVTASFCFAHQTHLIVKALLDVLDNHTWTIPPDPNNDEPQHDQEVGPHGVAGLKTKYFASVATVANVWRAPGAPSQIRRAAVGEYNDQINYDYFKIMPGRPLRGRWEAIDSVEKILVSAQPYLAKVFTRALGKGRQSGIEGLSEKDVGDDAANYREEQKRYRQDSISFANSALFHVTVRISLLTKALGCRRPTRNTRIS